MNDQFGRTQAGALGPLFTERPARTTQAGVRAHHAKRKNKRDALRDLLADGAWHDLKALHAVGGWRYGARLHELRRAGAVIHSKALGPGQFAWALDRGDPPTIYADGSCVCPFCERGNAPRGVAP